jgi:creatinine amidohydrolase
MSKLSNPATDAGRSPAACGGIYRLAELDFTRLDALDRRRTAVIFTASPLEEHGPHLPVGTDVFISEFFAEQLARRIVELKPDWTVLLGPPLPLGASAFEHAGTLLARARTVRNAALDYGAALARQGFQYILVSNAHAGPRHVVALEEAAAVVTRRYGVRMLSLSGPVLWKVLRGHFTTRLEPLLGRALTEEEREALGGDAHGGLWETSLIMLARPELLKAEFSHLPPQRFSLLEAMKKNYPLRLGNQLGYIGSPAGANKEFGEAARKLLLEVVWEIAQRIFEAEDDSWQQTSLLYRIPFMRTAFPYVAGGAALLLAALGLFWWIR